MADYRILSDKLVSFYDGKSPSALPGYTSATRCPRPGGCRSRWAEQPSLGWLTS